MDKNVILDEIFNDDPFGLLEIASPSKAKTELERLRESFDEICAFAEQNGRGPEPNISNISEHQLFLRLDNLRRNPEKAEFLAQFDHLGLLQHSSKEINTLEDILEDDSFDLLPEDPVDLHSSWRPPKETSMPDYVARRKPCDDFSEFEPLFKKCQADLAERKRKLYPFKNEQQISKGSFFVLHGVLLYVADRGEMNVSKGKKNTRLRCIFVNGTESDMLLRSLAAELYKNGRRVTEHSEKLLSDFEGISSTDAETGIIYVLKTASQDEDLRAIPHLHKIGFSTSTLEQRIKDAVNDPTYLMAPVIPVAKWTCYNLNPQKFENLIHRLFEAARLHLTVVGPDGNTHTPREWYNVPLDVIEQAIEFIISGEIVHYKYDPVKCIIIGK